ncbi:hypothetical protein L6164_001662 [Bauhinia variegata]|uniref:Uncharacterized protein n=1 Tax=Bauhinia variegata TaxID=167791 RepID=A0ACB9QA36_BAUVA|nr:hypothetical protein L6164_001662 [Bauhinia variegata]
MADFTDEFEPLFDYTRVQPLNNIVYLDDDDDVDEDCAKKRRKVSVPVVEKEKTDTKVVQVVDGEETEEDWLPPPPKVSNNVQIVVGEDSTLRELRLKKQELVSFAQSAKDMLQTVEESAKREFGNSLQSSFEAVSEKTPKPQPERVKIVICIQNKDEQKQFRIYMDDKFERLFKMYAEKQKLDPKHLVFSFDGDKINPSQTPAGLEMEDDDIIEVHVKSS